MNGWRSSALSLLVFGLAACGESDSSADVRPPGSTVNAVPVATNDDYRASRDNTLRVGAPGVLGNDSDGNGDLLTARLLGEPAHGALTLLPDGSFSYTPAPGFTGTDAFSYVARDGARESAVTAVTIAVGEMSILLEDTFSRATSASVGNGWTEVEAAGAAAVLDGTRLRFADTSDAVMRPVVTRRFPEVASGHLEWDFDLDWTKIADDDAYAVYMQLGSGARMDASSPTAGVGVNLVWGRVGTLDQTLGYRKAGATTALTPLAGRARSACASMSTL